MQRRLVEASTASADLFESATDTSAARQQQGSLYRPRPLKNNIPLAVWEADYRVKTGQNYSANRRRIGAPAKIGQPSYDQP